MQTKKEPRALTDIAILNLKPGAQRREIPDAKVAGLRLVLQPSGAKSWALRYRFDGQPKKFTIGGYPAVSIEHARKLARHGLGKIAMGTDPSAEKRSAREAAKAEQRRVTFIKALDDYLAVHVARNLKPSTQRETTRLLRRETAPWKSRPIASITKADVLHALHAMVARGADINANRLHSKLAHFFKWAKQRDLISANPCADISQPTSEKGRARERILDDWELALVWRAAEQLGNPYEQIIKLLMLTGARRSEVAAMSWAEIDAATWTWTLPKERSKNHRPHALPLPPLAMEILRGLPRFARRADEADFCFTPRNAPPNDFSKAKARLDKLMLELQHEQNPEAKPLAPWVIHDLRRSVASGMARLGVEIHVIERVLNHMSGSFGGIVSVYQKHRYEDQMRLALERWAAHIERVVGGSPETNVVELVRG